jgi:hypothetical protein
LVLGSIRARLKPKAHRLSSQVTIAEQIAGPLNSAVFSGAVFLCTTSLRFQDTEWCAQAQHPAERARRGAHGNIPAEDEYQRRELEEGRIYFSKDLLRAQQFSLMIASS